MPNHPKEHAKQAYAILIREFAAPRFLAALAAHGIMPEPGNSKADINLAAENFESLFKITSREKNAAPLHKRG